METKYQTLRRPRRKLCYVTNKESPCKQWAEKLSLGDIDGMFDDLDSSLHVADISSPSPLRTSEQRVISPVLQEGHLTVKLPVPGRDILNSVRRSLAPELDNVKVSNVPFKVHEPVKTSSPIEEKIDAEAVEEEDNVRALVVPPILNFEEPKPDHVNIQISQSNGLVTEEKNNSDLDSPPSKISLGKPTMSEHKKQVATSCKVRPPSQEKTAKKPQSRAKSKTQRQENREPSVSAVRQDPEHNNLSFDKQPSAERSTHGGKDIKSFLQKVKDAEKTKLACSRGLQSLVKVPIPPSEPEDDFLILEDDIPLIYIPCKSSSRQRQKETKAEQSSTDKHGSTDEGTTDSQKETAEKVGNLENKNSKQTEQVNPKIKKNKGKNKRGPRDEKEDFSPSDLVQQEKPNKKKQDRKVSKGHKDIRETDKKSSQDGEENAESNPKPNNMVSLSGKKCIGSGAQKEKTLGDARVRQNTLPVVNAGSSPEYSKVLDKRKRKQPGQWWLNAPQDSDDKKITDNQPTLKKPKQNNTDSKAGLSSAASKDQVLRKIKQKRPAPVSIEHTNTAKEKITKRNVKKIIRGETPNKRKTTDEVLTNDVEQIGDYSEQQDVPDMDQDHENLSPLMFPQRDLSLSSGNKVFQKVYHHASNEIMSSTSTSVSARSPQQQPREGKTDKRKRNPPGNWWTVSGITEDLENSSSKLQKQNTNNPKPCKERKTQSKQSRSPRLGTPKHGNMAVSSKPLGGTPMPSLKLKPLSAPRTVKRSLAMFKDIYTSATDTEAEMSNKETCQINTDNVHAHLAEEVSVLLQNHDTPPDSKCQSENTIKELKSGPSSMIQLEQYEDNEDLILPSSRVHAALSMSDLCAPPLKPLILQPKDKANLTEWFKSLWPSTAPNAAEISPNEFEWYFYQGRAIGFLLDVNCGSACIGRILLGSYTKKPLWVDHSASTVFNLLTSSVKVVIDSKESHIHAGQSFTVQCGHAYSIQNITAQPAVMYFTRIMEDGSD